MEASRCHYRVISHDPRVHRIQVNLLCNLVPDHVLAHLFCFRWLLAGQSIQLLRYDRPVDCPMLEGQLTHECLALAEVALRETQAILIILDFELHINVADLGIEI